MFPSWAELLLETAETKERHSVFLDVIAWREQANDSVLAYIAFLMFAKLKKSHYITWVGTPT